MENFDLVSLITAVGYIGIFVSLFLENGVLIFFFLPGDSLLLTAGFLAGQGVLDIRILVVGSFITAILGYMAGYHIGIKYGLKLFENGDTRFLKVKHLEQSRAFYKKHGPMALVLARFLPLRSFVCFLAGVTEMPYGTFMIYNVIGAFLWAVLLPIIGYYLGQMIPLSDLKILTLVPVVAIIGTLICIQVIWMYHKRKKKAQPPSPTQIS